MEFIPDEALSLQHMNTFLSEEISDMTRSGVATGGSGGATGSAPAPPLQPASTAAPCEHHPPRASVADFPDSETDEDPSLQDLLTRKKLTQARYRRRKKAAATQAAQQYEHTKAGLQAAEAEHATLTAQSCGYKQILAYQAEAASVLPSSRWLAEDIMASVPPPPPAPPVLTDQLKAEGVPAHAVAAMADITPQGGLLQTLYAGARSLSVALSMDYLWGLEYDPPEAVLRWFAKSMDSSWMSSREAVIYQLVRRDMARWEADPDSRPSIERKLAVLFRRRAKVALLFAEIRPDLLHRYMAEETMPRLPEDGGVESQPCHAPFVAARVSSPSRSVFSFFPSVSFPLPACSLTLSSLVRLIFLQELIDADLTAEQRHEIRQAWHKHCASLDAMQGPMADELDRLKALAAAQTNHWENALAGMVASVSKKAANGLVEVDACRGKCEWQMREALMVSVQLRVDLLKALTPVQMARLHIAVPPYLVDPVCVCRYLLRADRA